MTVAAPRPAFVTADECRQWMAVTPLGNPIQALAHLLRQLNLLNRRNIDPNERLAILEVLRRPLLLAQEEGARRFVGKPLPLVPPEQAAFDSAQALWHALLSGYGRCIEAELKAGTEPTPKLALVIQRAFAIMGAVQLDIYRAGFEPTPQHWQALHELYATAEASRVAESEVVDTARQGKTPTSPQAAYAEVLLLHAASPRELSSRHLVWVARWARRWARKARILTAAPGHDEESIPLHIDLAGKQPANYQPTAGADARWLETGGIRQSLKKRLSLLDKGSTPAELQLGDDCPQPVCGQILRHVYQRWCKGGSTRKHERRAVDGTCLVVPDIEAIYFHLAGKQQFRQPGYSDDDALRRERDEMATFGSIAPSSLGGLGSQSGHHVEEWKVIEEWSVVEESATGIHATHLVDENLARINQRQLLAVQPPGANSLLIGYVRWSMVTDDNRLHIGILILPGRPEPVALRPMDASGVREPYRPGFRLPAVPAIGSIASIITPPGYFRAGRILEVATGPVQRIRVLQLLDRGIDFDRVSYEPLT